ncbi:MAG: DUF3078 domain-containing protein [Bacteroidia bacterium]|nr:MAG: DUF3078 domain-containing protein [Bacteroidia bacterium]
MKKIFFTLIIVLLSFVSKAQESTHADTLWKFSGTTSLNLSQLSLTNWAAGGDNSLSGNALINLSAIYATDKTNWENKLTLGFGLIKQGDDPTRKSDDQIDLASKLGLKASDKWFYTGLLGFKTQFAQGYDNPGDVDRLKISNFMSPGYLGFSLGMDYKPSEAFSLFLSPLSSKFTFVLDEDLSAAGAFGLDPGQSARAELGAYIKMAFKKEILKNVTLDTKIDFFSNYLDHPQHVDVNWDLLLTFGINDYLSASLLTQLIYDYDIKFGTDTTGDGVPDTFDERVQFKELFGLGLTYSF